MKLRRVFLVVICLTVLVSGRSAVMAQASQSPAGILQQSTTIGSPLPLTCPGNPAPAACIWGYAYFAGSPVAGAFVDIDAPLGALSIVTTNGTASSAPYFETGLNNAPLLVSVGDRITLTATYSGYVVETVHVVVPGGQQIDVVFPSEPRFGNGSDGSLNVTGVSYADSIRSALSASASVGTPVVPVVTTAGFTVGQVVLLLQMQGMDAGTYEYGQIIAVNASSLTLDHNLATTYFVGGNARAQVLRVPQYQNVTIQPSGQLTAHAWDGATGGIVAFRANGFVNILGAISVSGEGFRGGAGTIIDGVAGQQGESPLGIGTSNGNPNGGGGGGGQEGRGGGGGGFGSLGATAGNNPPIANAGLIVGQASLITVTVGNGGGGGAHNMGAGNGGTGGGAILISARTLTVTGNLLANGANGEGHPTTIVGGGGGSGGAIKLLAMSATLGSGLIWAQGGAGGPNNSNPGGAGGVGRIRIEALGLTGTTNPAAITDTLTLLSPPIVTIHWIQTQPQAISEATISFAGSAQSPNLVGADIITYVWRSSLDGVLSTTANFTRTASSLSPGTHTIYFKARDSHNVWSEEISRTLTIMGPANHTVFLPTTLDAYQPPFVGPYEAEDNDSAAQANGPLLASQDYYGFPNDFDDYYYFEGSMAGPIQVSILNFTGLGGQLQLFYQSTGNQVGYAGGAPFLVNYTGPAGIYYVRVYTGSGFQNNLPYTLRVLHP